LDFYFIFKKIHVILNVYPSDTRRKKTFRKTECPQVQAFHFPKCESKASLRALLESGLEINTLEKFQRRPFTGNEITDGKEKNSKLNK